MNYSHKYWLHKVCNSHSVTVIGITFVGALLRFYQLGREPLWVDEAATWRFALLPFSQLWGEDAVRETNPPLYYTLQKLWLIFGESEAALRSLSAILGIISIPLIYGIGRILSGHTLGLIASVILATSRFNIQYSQEARAYSLQVTAATLSIWGLAYLFTNPKLANTPIGQGFTYSLRLNIFRFKENTKKLVIDLAWLAYISGICIALYCHNTSVLLLILCNVITCIWWITTGSCRKQFLVNWIIANAISLIIWSWWIPKILQQTVVSIREFWITPPTVYNLLEMLTGIYINQYFLILALLGGIWYWRHQPINIILTLTLSIGTLVLAFFISLWRSIFISRIFVWTTIPAFVLIAASLLSLRKKFLITILLATLLFFQLQDTRFYYKSYRKEPWNKVGYYVQSLAKQNDMILLFPSSIDSAFQYYFKPEKPITQFGIQRFKQQVVRSLQIQVTEITKSNLSNTIRGFNRVWLVTRSRKREDPQDILVSDISKNMKQLNRNEFGNLEVLLFEQTKQSSIDSSPDQR